MTTYLISEKFETAARLFGQSIEQKAKRSDKLISEMLENNIQPTFFLAPSNELSTCSPFQYNKLFQIVGSGFNQVIKGTDNATLFTFTDEQYKELIADKREMIKAEKKETNKAKLCVQRDSLAERKAARVKLSRRITPELRDLSNKLITSYAKRDADMAVNEAKTNDKTLTKADLTAIANEAKNAKRAELLAECGRAPKAETEQVEQSKNVQLDYASKLLKVLQESDELFSNLTAQENTALITLLNKVCK